MVVVSIEGLMGTGKTSLLESLEKKGYKVDPEIKKMVGL
jgi:predicted ATPase